MKPRERRYHEEVRQPIPGANELTMPLNHDHLESEHLVAGMLGEKTGTAVRLLREIGAEPRTLAAWLLSSLVPGHDMATASRVPGTPCAVRTIENAEAIADKLGGREVDARHLLLVRPRAMAEPHGCCVKLVSTSSPCAAALAAPAAATSAMTVRRPAAMARDWAADTGVGESHATVVFPVLRSGQGRSFWPNVHLAGRL